MLRAWRRPTPRARPRDPPWTFSPRGRGIAAPSAPETDAPDIRKMLGQTRGRATRLAKQHDTTGSRRPHVRARRRAGRTTRACASSAPNSVHLPSTEQPRRCVAARRFSGAPRSLSAQLRHRVLPVLRHRLHRADASLTDNELRPWARATIMSRSASRTSLTRKTKLGWRGWRWKRRRGGTGAGAAAAAAASATAAAAWGVTTRRFRRLPYGGPRQHGGESTESTDAQVETLNAKAAEIKSFFRSALASARGCRAIRGR